MAEQQAPTTNGAGATPSATMASGEKTIAAKPTETFYVDAVLFDMDGTLVDSISAVEAAWGAVAEELGQDPDHVIAATHGKRAVDNLKSLKPWIRSHEMDDAVVAFETTILDYADGRRTPSISSRRNSRSASRRSSSSAGVAGRKLSQGGLGGGVSAFGLSQGLSKLSDMNAASKDTSAFDDDDEALDKDIGDAMEAEEEAFDGAIRILPGVRQMIDSIPDGKYAVATSSARTYAYGAMERVGITPPPVTITAEHPELKRGKPHPDPFLLAAKKLGYDPKKCLVVEDSPSGIKAAVASGGIVIAVCTSHTYDKVCNLGAHHVVFSLDQVKITPEEDGRLKVVIEHPEHAVQKMHAGEVCQGLLPEEVEAAVQQFKTLDIAKKEKKAAAKQEKQAQTAKQVGADQAKPVESTA